MISFNSYTMAPLLMHVQPGRDGMASQGTRMSKLWAERLTAIGMIIAAGYIYFESQELPFTSGDFPVFTAIVVIILALAMIVRSFVTHDEKLSGHVNFDFSYTAWKPAFVLIIAVLYALAVFRIGFYTSSIIFFFIVTFMTGIRNFKVMAATAVVLFPLMYVFFTWGLEADLPQGLLI